MDQREVRYEVEGGTARLTIDREAARNALSPLVVQQLIEGLERADADAAVRCVVLTGAGQKVFCAGGDLGGMTGDGFLSGHEGRRGYGLLLQKFQQVKKPTIARVNGHALAGGHRAWCWRAISQSLRLTPASARQRSIAGSSR
jgi:enoyl-CoA hydratase